MESNKEKSGHWIKMTGMMIPELHGHYECSECGWHLHWTCSACEKEFLYCPHCGIRMNKE